MRVNVRVNVSVGVGVGVGVHVCVERKQLMAGEGEKSGRSK